MIPRLTPSFYSCYTGDYPSKKWTLMLCHCHRLILMTKFCLKPQGDLPTLILMTRFCLKPQGNLPTQCFVLIGKFSLVHFWTQLRRRLDPNRKADHLGFQSMSSEVSRVKCTLNVMIKSIDPSRPTAWPSSWDGKIVQKSKGTKWIKIKVMQNPEVGWQPLH